MSDWQFCCKEVKERGAQILESSQWADCSFLVGRDYEKTRFSAHKLFLAMATPVFDCMLNGPMAPDEQFIEIPDVRPEAFKGMLQYIYTDQINIQSFEHACELYYCANKYMLPHLVMGCVEYLRNNLTPQNVCQTYEFSQMFNETALFNDCIELILLKTKELLSDPSFMDTKLSTLKEILKFNVLNIDSELDLYHAIETYSRIHTKAEGSACEDDQTISSSSEAQNNTFTDLSKNTANDLSTNVGNNIKNTGGHPEDDENRDQTNNQTFRALIPEVRLLTLTPQQFAENVALSPFITKAESYELLMNIASNKTTVPLPKGFSNSYKQRYKLQVAPERNIDLGLSREKGRSETTFRFEVTNFSESMLMSLPFYVRNLSWRIAVNPKAKSNNDEQNQVGIFLYCCWVNKSVQWSCPVKAEISLVSNKSNAVHLVRSIEHTFTSKENNRGSQIPFETILDPKHGYLKNNVLIIEVHMVAEEPTNINFNNTF